MARRSGIRAAVAAVFLAAGAALWASADTTDTPEWDLAKDRYDGGGSSAFLTPGNDTRVNLLLLLADRRGTAVAVPGAAPPGPPLALFPWEAMAAAAEPRPPASDEAYDPDAHHGSRCQSDRSGAAAFVEAVRANRHLAEEERQRLIAAREGFRPDCAGGGQPLRPVAAPSPEGRAFAAYLAAAELFYAGAFPVAAAGFSALAAAPDPWVRETALYMVARSELNRAQENSFDEYGGLAEPERRDQAAIASAGAAFERYLDAYPAGRYAASARGLGRRVAWLAGDAAALAERFDRQLAGTGRFDGSDGAVAIAEEIDRTLLLAEVGAATRNPLLLAVVALQRMRCVDDWETPQEECGPRLSREELERQAPLFKGEEALFGYLQAAHAWFVRGEAKEVLALIPDAAHQRRLSYLEFSRQVLRGVALEAAGDRNARAFWLSLFPGAVQPYQSGALELALAIHDERAGTLDRIFAADSKVRHPVMRQLLLEHSAGPDLLRRQAADESAPKQERDVALYILLAKELQRGFYREFLDDLRLMPASVPAEEHYYDGASRYDPQWLPELAPPPLGRFSRAARTGETCPPLRTTASRLAADPEAIGARLCLAEFLRVNGFDGFPFDERLPGKGLGSAPSQFPGKPYHRLEVYKAIIADPAATPEQRAMALNRAVRCYAPVGNNSCGGVEVPLSQRRAWYQRLKKEHAGSRWATSLRYYW